MELFLRELESYLSAYISRREQTGELEDIPGCQHISIDEAFRYIKFEIQRDNRQVVAYYTVWLLTPTIV